MLETVTDKLYTPFGLRSLAPDDWPRLTAACDRLMKAPIYVDDSGAITIMELRSKARRLKSREMEADAGVRPLSERQVRARLGARRVEAVRVGMGRRVPVGRGQGHDDEIAAPDRRPVQLDIRGGEPVDPAGGRLEAQ